MSSSHASFQVRRRTSTQVIAAGFTIAGIKRPVQPELRTP
jgi:hypothetical protein